MSLFVVIYTYADGSANDRGERGADHVAFLRELHEAGTLRLCGPLNPEKITGGMIILEAGSAIEAGELLDSDPFWTIGAVAERSIEPFEVVIGSLG